jgi:hypothetical protein
MDEPYRLIPVGKTEDGKPIYEAPTGERGTLEQLLPSRADLERFVQQLLNPASPPSARHTCWHWPAC